MKTSQISNKMLNRRLHESIQGRYASTGELVRSSTCVLATKCPSIERSLVTISQLSVKTFHGGNFTIQCPQWDSTVTFSCLRAKLTLKMGNGVPCRKHTIDRRNRGNCRPSSFQLIVKIKSFKRVGYFIAEMACWTAEGRLERSKGGGKGLENGGVWTNRLQTIAWMISHIHNTPISCHLNLWY